MHGLNKDRGSKAPETGFGEVQLIQKNYNVVSNTHGCVNTNSGQTDSRV